LDVTIAAGIGLVYKEGPLALASNIWLQPNSGQIVEISISAVYNIFFPPRYKSLIAKDAKYDLR
jgi:hypothetical protein